MAVSGGLDFAPVLHNILPERVAVVYNVQKTGSQEVAEYYRDKRSIPNDNLIPISVPVPQPGATGTDCENTILNEADYQYLIEDPLKLALENLGNSFSTDNARSIWVIVLCYGIPIAFDDNGQKIAVASKLHRLGHVSDTLVGNHTYDRRGTFKFFDHVDASELLITAVLDGPTVLSVKKLIDRSIDVDNQTFVAGKIYIDPYGKKVEAEEIVYQNDILDFISNELPNLSLEGIITVDVNDPYQEPTISSLTQDSFYWGWFNPTYSKSLFSNQNERRVFLYNADDRGACNIHYYDSSANSAFDSNGSDLWCNLAINVEPGYACCAGAVDNPGADSFLRPRPFFETLHQGATIGEAFLFASKHVSWKTVLIGDPLMVVNFPVDLPIDQNISNTQIPNDEAILRTKVNVETSLAWADRQTRLLLHIRDIVTESSDFDEELQMLHAVDLWHSQKNTNSQSDLYYSIINKWIQYIQLTTNTNVSEWLINHNYKVTNRISSVIEQMGVNIDSSLKYSPGRWQYDFIYIHPILTLENVFFHLEVSKNDKFTDLAVDTKTSDTVSGWKYEINPYEFASIPTDGYPSNFSGRRLRFEPLSDNFLTPTEVYYVRWTPLNVSGTPLSVTSSSERIIIA